MRKQTLKTIEYSENLVIKMMISIDESTLYASVNYNDGEKKAACEKSFKNNIMGVKAMETFIEAMTEKEGYGILKYFNMIGEDNA
jgi:hypothetical protein